MGGTVEWNTDTWASWTDNTVKTHTVDGVTITAGGNASAYKYGSDDYLFIYANSTSTNTVTFSADAPFNRIEFTKKTPSSSLWVSPLDGWSLSSDQTTVIWEGEATKSLVCETCTLSVTKIKFFCENSVTDNGDGTYNVAAGKSITLKATPAEGYLLEGWYNGTTKIEAGDAAVIDDEALTLTLTPEADMTISARFVEPTYAVTFADDLAEPTRWTASPATDVEKGQTVTVTYTGSKKVIGVKVEKKATVTYPLLSAATTSDQGKVVCAAGHLHDAKTAVPDGCTAVGILGKVTETGHGLILALQDAAQQNWNTINGWTSVTTYAGTTLKVLPDDAARGTNLTSYTTLGETTVSNWAVAQKSDYEAIFTNLGSTKGDSDGMTYDANVNAYITEGVGGTAISGYNWSATEDVDDYAWYFSSGCWYGLDKSSSRSVRPVLGF